MTEGLLNFKKYYKNIKRNIMLNNYYLIKIKNGKNIYAVFFDWIFSVLIVTILLFISIYALTSKLTLTVILTVILVSTYVVMSIFFNKRQHDKKIVQVNKDMANKEVLKNLTKYNNRDFALYIKELLERYYNTTFFEYNKYIDFMGEINGEIYGIKCFKNSLEDPVILKDMEHYIIEMESKDIKDGIIVTSSTFSDEVKEKLDYILIDFDYIKKMLKETDSYPTISEIEELIISKYNKRKEYFRSSFMVINKRKIYRFLILGISLIILSNFMTYKLYYKIIGIFSICIGIGIAIYNITKSARFNK